jgi:hypothetical protein
VRFVKGFAANFFFYFFVALIASLASLTESEAFQNGVELALLESQLVEQRFFDAADYYNGSFRDVVIDSAHQACCGDADSVCEVIGDNLPAYSYAASRALYHNGVNSSLQEIGFYCVPVLLINHPPFEEAFYVSREATLNVSTGNVSRLARVEFSTRFYLNTSSDNPGGEQNFWVMFDEGGEWNYESFGSC